MLSHRQQTYKLYENTLNTQKNINKPFLAKSTVTLFESRVFYAVFQLHFFY